MIFSSLFTVKSMIDDVMEKLGLYTPPTRADFYKFYNECLTRLYTEVICHRSMVEMTVASGFVTYNDLMVKASQSVSGEDICDVAVKSPFNPILRATAWTQKLLPANTACYVCEKDRINLYPSSARQTYLIFYTYRPSTVTAGNESTLQIALPPEYHNLLRAKLRGEAYKQANEDELAAKWLGEYNLLLEDFCRYVARKKEALSE